MSNPAPRSADITALAGSSSECPASCNTTTELLPASTTEHKSFDVQQPIDHTKTPLNLISISELSIESRHSPKNASQGSRAGQARRDRHARRHRARTLERQAHCTVAGGRKGQDARVWSSGVEYSGPVRARRVGASFRCATVRRLSRLPTTAVTLTKRNPT